MALLCAGSVNATLKVHFTLVPGRIMEQIFMEGIFRQVQRQRDDPGQPAQLYSGQVCLTSLVAFSDGVTETVVKGRLSSVVCLEFVRLGGVPHGILNSRLERCALEGWTVQWMRNWLNGCRGVEGLCVHGGQLWVVSLRALGPVLFNASIANGDSGIECTLIKFAVTRNLCLAWGAGPWETEEGQEVHLAQGSSRHGYSLGAVTENSPAEDLGVLMDEKLSTSQQCAPRDHPLAAAFLCPHFSFHQNACFVKRCHPGVWSSILQEKLDFLERSLAPEALCAHCNLKWDLHSWDCREETRLELSLPQSRVRVILIKK